MKYLVILADGMADLPIPEWNNKTPLMVANKPVMDHLCAQAQTGLLQSVPEGMHPGSEIANMNILGFDPKQYFPGRGVLEAAALNIPIKPDDLVFRCNLVTVENDRLINHSAGHISNEEAGELIKFLNASLKNEGVRFYQGVSYRNLMMLENGRNNIVCHPPHDHPGEKMDTILPHGNDGDNQTSKVLTSLIKRSIQLLDAHPVNQKRRDRGLSPANAIWPWSPGKPGGFPSFQERWGIESGAVISAVDLIHGIGSLAGLENIYVEGATGLFDTNYEGKAAAALTALKKSDFVFLHVEAADEAGHEGDKELKKKVVEDFDSRLLKPLWDGIQKMDEEVTLALLPDHPTPCALRTHTADPVPFLLIKPGETPDEVKSFDEFSVRNGVLGLLKNGELLQKIFS
ncbi:cofactor-independent phosphoglycerate mutase [Thermophagus xiamenensis]|uniref:2,3-bisphosphoglycerate-independent phosphoglycerate mutase n=1 Tax=Thermophagus xiamenensis TaxID=385682 RepID=A0A1I1WHC5_9BACT|nr:cofactor-independent phosphoglycerate mutase [Thermophagus xiamenensis]SFD94566.1 2,3-bisphosphoglycerate-independent phosphoglycerate mutase [Thermophagus xiamenensis]